MFKISILNNSNPSRGTIFIGMLPEQGAYNASFEIARRLKQRDFRVIYGCTSKFNEHITNQGFDVCVFSETETAKSNAINMGRNMDSRRQSGERYLDILKDISQLADAYSPVLVLLDPLLWHLSPPLLSQGIPIIGLNTTLASVFQVNTPPVFSGVIPRANNKGNRLKCLFAWVRILVSHYKIRWYKCYLAMRAFGFTRWRNYDAYSLVCKNGGKLRCGEYGFRLKVPELVLSPRKFDYPEVSTWTPRYYIGSCVAEGRKDGTFDWSKLRKEKGIIYCSLGTYSRAYPHGKRLFVAVIEAVKNQDKWQLIVQLGRDATIEEYGTVPENIVLAQWVPQLEILAAADVFITHGGFSSVRESIYYGVPMVVFPCWLDQAGNAARVEFHNLGVRAEIAEVNAKMVATLLEKVTEDSAIREGIKRMQRVFRSEADYNTGADMVAHFLERRTEAARPSSTSIFKGEIDKEPRMV